MAITKVRMDEAKSASNTIKAKIHEQEQKILDFKSLILSLEGNWGGEGYQQYVTVFENMLPSVDKTFDEIRENNSRVEKLLLDLEKSDDAVANLFRIV